MRLATRMVLAGGLVTLSIAALSACGGSKNNGGAGAATAPVTGGGKVVDIYSSLPMQGPSAAAATAVVAGIRLALAQAGAKAGRFAVQYSALDDSSGDAGWDASQTAANARKAAADPRAVYYIGEFDDGASEVSMPILNEAGIPQVSPANTYVGLTTSDPGSASDEPRRYSPTGTRTYLRIVPIDSVQAAGVLTAMKQAGCASVAIADDGEPYGAGMAKLIMLERPAYGTDVVSETSLDLSASGSRAYAARLKAARPDCFLLAGVGSQGAALLTKDVHAVLPMAKLFVPSAMCASSWTTSRDGGVPAAIDRQIECLSLTRSLSSYPGGKAFVAAYKAKYGVGNPSPWAILGYEAMRLGLSTIAGLGTDGDSKSAVRSALFATHERRSVLGTYGFDNNGDTTLRSYGLYKLGPTAPMFVRTITPQHVL